MQKIFICYEQSETERKVYQARLKRVPAWKRVYVDESGIHYDLYREKGHALWDAQIHDARCGRKLVAPLWRPF
jgi:hypothetical protein